MIKQILSWVVIAVLGLACGFGLAYLGTLSTHTCKNIIEIQTATGKPVIDIKKGPTEKYYVWLKISNERNEESGRYYCYTRYPEGEVGANLSMELGYFVVQNKHITAYYSKKSKEFDNMYEAVDWLYFEYKNEKYVSPPEVDI